LAGRLEEPLRAPQRIGAVGCAFREVFGPNHALTLP
jgi:hypothetical protein